MTNFDTIIARFQQAADAADNYAQLRVATGCAVDGFLSAQLRAVSNRWLAHAVELTPHLRKVPLA